MHQEANRPVDKLLPSRYSRHYYDLARLSLSDVKDNALASLEILMSVVEFKQRFYPSSWACYTDAKPPTFKLIPPKYRISNLEKDYQAMQNMIFDQNLNFDEILEALSKLEKEINEIELI